MWPMLWRGGNVFVLYCRRMAYFIVVLRLLWLFDARCSALFEQSCLQGLSYTQCLTDWNIWFSPPVGNTLPSVPLSCGSNVVIRYNTRGFTTKYTLRGRGFCREYSVVLCTEDYIIAQNKPSTDFQLGWIACSRFGPLPQIHKRVSINSLSIICDGEQPTSTLKMSGSSLIATMEQS